jgi:hypothetical protein
MYTIARKCVKSKQSSIWNSVSILGKYRFQFVDNMVLKHSRGFRMREMRKTLTFYSNYLKERNHLAHTRLDGSCDKAKMCGLD